MPGVFDPEGPGYDYETAIKFGLGPDITGHWPSRVPQTGLILKGRKHKTWPLTVEGEKKAGYIIIKRNGRYYSLPVDDLTRDFRLMDEALRK